MKPTDQTERLYRQIYKNAAMGLGTTSHLLKTSRSRNMADALRMQNAEYSAICKNAKSRMLERGKAVKGLSPMEKMRTDGMVSLNLLMNGSDAEKERRKNPSADPYAKALMRHLSDFEKSTLDKMKGFL